jgi:Fic family protein
MKLSLEKLFLKESNAIEGEYSKEALEDAIYAWEYLKSLPMPFNSEAVKWTHYFLMERLRPDIAGMYRACDVSIGGSIKPFISLDLIESDVKYQMMGIAKSIENTDKISDTRKMSFAKEEHVKFEYIHPFEDGNGRVGRMYWNLHRLKFGLPIEVIRESEKKLYYEWFDK